MIRADQLEVHVEIDGATVLAGTAYFHRGRGQLTSTTFNYEPGYIGLPGSYDLDPALPLTTGAQHIQGGLPGAFSDCAPDRWGRNLISKLERANAAAEERTVRRLDDADFLTGVSDITRQGGLRFRAEKGPFLAADSDVPKLIRLPELLRASEVAARDAGDSTELAAVKQLLAAGTGSLGGARPKASVQGPDGQMLIAKFPHPDDGWDVMAWEATALDLAEMAGVRVPGRRLEKLDGKHVLLLDRFDRIGSARVGYMSAMTALERRDGEGGDYEEIAEQLETISARPSDDAHELYRRVVFSVGVNNTDDHLRNHGFIRHGAGWVLSPAFDINPNPHQEARQTAIAGTETREAAPAALDRFAVDCRLSSLEAEQVRRNVAGALANWREVARRNGVPAAELDLFAPAFQQGLDTLGWER